MVSAREDHLSQFYQFNLKETLEQGQGWVVGQHEIVYLKPVVYYEPIWIQTSLIAYTDRYLQVEAQMLDKGQRQLKALLWTKYHYVNPTLGKKAAHPPGLMAFFEGLLNREASLETGLAGRVAYLLGKPLASRTND